MAKKKSDNQLSGLKAYSAAKNQESLEKVNKAIDKLKKKGSKITFDAVAKEAGVSRATIYNNEVLKERVNSLKATSTIAQNSSEPPQIKTKAQLQDEKIKALRERIKELESDKDKLIAQLVDYEEIKDENERLKAQINKNNLKVVK